jgi:diguanylate cyclase
LLKFALKLVPMKTILVIEDDDTIRSNLVELLDLEGFRVLEANQGNVGVCKAKTYLPDLVLCDIQMPELDGYGVLEALRGSPTTATIPLIFLTARTDHRSVRQGMNLGADDYLTKPCSMVELTSAIASRLKQRTALTQLYAKEQRLALEILERKALLDPLTNLPTRNLLCQNLQGWMDRDQANEVAVFCLNIHRFRTINASFGHNIGDILLQMVAHRLQKTLGTRGTVARLNGDEFGIGLMSIAGDSAPVEKHQAQIAEVAQQLFDAISAPYLIDGQQIRIQASIGISTSETGRQSEQLLTQAEMAQSWSQSKGALHYRFYYLGMEAMEVERRLIEMDLRQAIAQSEFQVYYQPQVDVQTGVIIGMEALLRWNHPSRGMISPVKFIPIAEELGLIVPLGEWVLRTSCQQVQKWQKNNSVPIRVSVNLSMRQLQQPDLVDRVAAILAETGVDPDLVILELTETCVMQDVKQSIETLKGLRNLGVGISIDDFGTGYSSLNYLTTLPINGLKIDRSFIKEVTTDSDAATILSAILGLAEQLKLKVVAEGVETMKQLSFLKDTGCQAIQGFLYSPALPAAEISSLLLTDPRW